MNVSRLTGVLCVSSVGLAVILLMLVGSGQNKITRWLYYVICKQRKDQILLIERECINPGRTMDCLSWRNNTWHAKLEVF